jgi:A/G-specific adenine glycosylase
MNFSEEIIGWYSRNKRDLPWRNTTDAYKVWLSEIILQQTRVAQGIPYYNKFTKHYPTVNDLAKAPQDEILKLWQGLGYYSRARNMHAAAQTIVNDYKGQFPNSYSEILKLKGVGKYTAAAIASIAFNEAVAVVDGNVYRVLARYFGIEEPIDTGKGQKLFFDLANELILKKQPATFNQAMMEFGALYCTPKNPDCTNCIFANSCKAYANNTVQQLPIKANKTKIKKRYFNYLFFDKPRSAFLQQRIKGDIWEGLYEFPLIETDEEISLKTVLAKLDGFREITQKQDIKFIRKAFKVTHKLSHRDILTTFWHIGVTDNFLINNSRIFEIKVDTLHQYGVSRLTERFILEYLEKLEN